MALHLHRDNLGIERRLGDFVRARMPGVAGELVMFLCKQAWACFFGGLLLAMIIVTKLVWNPDWVIQRYDFLFIFAILVQVLFLRFKLETWEEARVILLFHATGTAMEWFKVHAGSWGYPEPALFKLMGVPLFSGFMYAAVGSYIARVIRIFAMRFAPYPPFWMTMVLAVAIYVNFFAHHFVMDIRLGLFVATIVLFARTKVWFVNTVKARWMPMPLAAFLASFALWMAENVGTATGTWLYSGQISGQWVSFAKLGSWYLLLYVAFATVTVVSRSALSRR
ncbi:Uncharacterized membrane protein YoaT, DUF817 family [Pseudorhodobacter antarcticus]|jgi:uncharacterized membrane protein YoaT (DUF817 family)|uniref:Uncharacterized membrane protein YoaT, DUF817 family n=1 Tax=Pseudorhodobacter antarcticus TaxID=1077947 RepID=A0A1H8EMG2_9RHOB|nr:DUF817 domain-containing protein [Pseudorhodobacter antarcticus]SEN20314.1 Uncharacterized membrane protein YoaT, DUF817 family [Pseudorhodobacter antarcticus]